MKLLPRAAIRGHWNKHHTSWTTVDGHYKIVRRFPTPGVESAWVFYATSNAEGKPFARYGEARRFLREVIDAPSTTLKSVKDTGE